MDICSIEWEHLFFCRLGEKSVRKNLKKNKQQKRNIFNLEPQEKVDMLIFRKSEVL